MDFPLWDGAPTECDPDSDEFFCCTKIGVCMAQCPDNNKIDFRNDRKTNETKGNITGDIQLLDRTTYE